VAVSSTVQRSNLFGATRLDAEFYQPKYAENETILARFPSTVKLGDISSKFYKGIFDIKAEEYVSEGVPFVRINNLKNGLIEDSNIAFITFDRHLKEARTALKRYDLILSKTAYPAASLVQLEECNCSQDTIVVRTTRSEAFNMYLATFLNTRFGLLQMERLFQGNIQMHLSLPEAKTIVIPQPGDNFQAHIRQLFERMIWKRQESQLLYTEAERILISELELNIKDYNHQVAYTRSWSEAANIHRLDAEYFQPKFQKAIALMSRSGKKIKDVAKLVKHRFKPKPGEPFHYIEIGNVGRDGLLEDELIMGENAPSRAQWIVRTKDIITSTVRPIRRLTGLIEEEQDGYVCSSGFAVLRSEGFEPELLMVYLRLPIVCEILDLHTTASMYPAISVTDLLNIPITLPATKARHEIVSRVQASRQALNEAKYLFNEAKIQVERMILSEE